jgi:hypothetical protein
MSAAAYLELMPRLHLYRAVVVTAAMFSIIVSAVSLFAWSNEAAAAHDLIEITHDDDVALNETLRRLKETEDIWLRRSKEEYAALKEQHESLIMQNLDRSQFQNLERFSICGRQTNTGTRNDLALLQHFSYMDGSCPGANSNDLLLLQGTSTYGRTGNNLIEFFHALQYSRDNNVLLGMMSDCWAFQMIFQMWWMPTGQDESDWEEMFEKTFCVKIFHREDELKGYNMIFSELNLNHRDFTKQLFYYVSDSPLIDYIGYQSSLLQKLLHRFNTGGSAVEPVRDMCSGLDAIFGTRNKKDIIYSVIHQRHMVMNKMNLKSGCHPTGAMNMEPEYVKAILRPLGMLQHPIVLLTDGGDPSVAQRLMADPEIAPMLRLIPASSSWVGGDITLGIMSNVFIGNPASSFSGFIAKSRLALGFGHNYLFRAKNQDGNWYTVCGDTCIFDREIMGRMS